MTFIAGVKNLSEHLCRPYGTRIYFPLYPALRLRLRAGLDYFAPSGLNLRLANPTCNCQVSVLAPARKPPDILQPARTTVSNACLQDGLVVSGRCSRLPFDCYLRKYCRNIFSQMRFVGQWHT